MRSDYIRLAVARVRSYAIAIKSAEDSAGREIVATERIGLSLPSSGQRLTGSALPSEVSVGCMLSEMRFSVDFAALSTCATLSRSRDESMPSLTLHIKLTYTLSWLVKATVMCMTSGGIHFATGSACSC